MNISHENKVIWWALEESGENEMSKILGNYGFHVENNENHTLNYDNRITKSGDFDDYKVICTIKNPYHRVFSLFLNRVLNNRAIKKQFLPILREKFNYFVDKSLISNKLLVKPIMIFDNPTPELMYFEKWTFDDKIPDYFVRIEHFYDDLSKIDFISDVEPKNGPLCEDFYDYSTMYDYETAKKVYHFYKKHFYLCEYNPFSFTNEDLTKDDKISFLHDAL
jgi:hypothetical protein